MGYIYDKLKEALGGAKFSSSHQSAVKDWTPNGVKALVIARDFIFVANHVKMAKVILLDVNEVATDIQQNGKSGALHNLLAQRQLSCMEEFYVDSVYLQYQGIMNMSQYIDRLVTEKSRLRFYGYIRGVSADELKEKFLKARLNGDAMYCYALDGSRKAVINYKSTDNSAWYKNYNLRPQYYALDADNGDLHRWFKRAEKEIESKVLEQSNALRSEYVASAMSNLAYQDLRLMDEILIYLSLGKYLSTAQADRVFTCVRHGMEEGQRNFKSAIKVPTNTINGTLSVLASAGEDVKNLSRVYKHFGIFDSTENAELNLDILSTLVQSESGILQFASRLDSVLYEIWLELENHYTEGKLIMIIESQKYASDIPNGKFRSTLGLGQGSGSVHGAMSVLLGLCGWTHESFKKYLQELAKQKKAK